MNWFASVAEAQYLRAAPDWQARDCSGLLRYAFIKALKPKTAAWRRSLPGRFGALPSTHLALYPMPYISRSVFRRAPGSYRLTDVAEGKLVGEASAYELMRYSSVYLGKDARAAVRGDLLFFVHPLASGSAYHSMVYLGNGRVVYHTGLSPGAGGRVKLVTLSALRQHPDPSWSPEAKNPSFLGFYRWKIVDSSLAP